VQVLVGGHSATLLHPQLPLMQAWPALFAAQLLPHVPQLLALLLRFVSHPLAGFPSQSP
jgi:hypothetical protein